MPAEVISGRGILHGINNSGTAITMTGYATFTLNGLKGTHNFDLSEIKENGFDVSLIAVNGHIATEITWTPSGATRAAAAATAVFLAPLAKVTIANCKVAAFNGDWVYVGNQQLDLGQAEGAMTLPCRKYDDATQNTSLTTTVTG